MSIYRSRTSGRLVAVGVALAALAPAGVAAATGDRGHHQRQPTLTGRAVLPVATYAPGPTSGNVPPAGTDANDGIAASMVEAATPRARSSDRNRAAPYPRGARVVTQCRA